MPPILALLALAGPVDMVVRNANIYTGAAAKPRATALAIRGGRIVALDEEAEKSAAGAARVVDLKGATVVPGFIDSHGHMAGLGQSLEMLDLRKARSAEEVAEMVSEAAKDRRKGEWIQGRGWDQTMWPGGAFPDAAMLSRAAPDHPVYLTRVDGHAAWVNRKALEAADVNKVTPDPAGGRILRGTGGEPAGVLVDRAMNLVRRRIPGATAAQVRDRIARAARECARWGLTSVHDAGVDEAEIEAYRELIRRRHLPVRIYAMIRGEGRLWERYVARGPETGERLTVRSIKLMADGALGSRGAALLEPYADDPKNSGLAILSRADVERVARAAAKANLQVNTHAIGDAANRAVLDAYGAVLGGANGRRFRVEHAQVVAPDDFERFARYSVIASMQAVHATSDSRWAEQRLGEARSRGAYAWRRFLELGVPVANGSDFPVESPSPIEGFWATVTRGGWRTDQKMTREEALRSWTWAGAYAAFEEKDKGTLEPGKWADLAVLSQDIMTAPDDAIRRTRVMKTMVGGEFVYSEVANEVFEVAKSQLGYLKIPDLDRPATLVCRYEGVNGTSHARVLLMSGDDVQRFQREQVAGWVAATEFGKQGELRAPIRRPGEHILVFDKGTSLGRARIAAEAWLEFTEGATFEARAVPSGRRAVIVWASLGLFALVAAWSGRRVWLAFGRREPDEFIPG